jgi:hypothetical protein
LLSPTDDSSLTNISDFSKLGLSSVKDSSAFKKIQYHSKSPASQLFDSSTVNYSKFDVLSTLYDNSSVLNNSKDYYTDRQDNYSSLLVSQLNSSSNLESKSVNKLLDYNFNLNTSRHKPLVFNNYLNLEPKNYFLDVASSERLNSNLLSTSPIDDKSISFLDISKNSLNVNGTSDGKYYNNPLKAILNTNNSRKLSLSLPVDNVNDLSINLGLSEVSIKFSNTELSSKFKELKSSNMSFLSPDKNTRLIEKIHSSKSQLNFSNEASNLSDILNKISVGSSAASESEIYNSSKTDWVSPLSLAKLLAVNTSTGDQNSPIYSNNPY